MDNREEYEYLATELKPMAETLNRYVSNLVASDAEDQMEHIAKYVPDSNPGICSYWSTLQIN